MTLLAALVLGAVEGLTEFLPVSSTGHLIVASRALGLGGEGVDSFIDAIQSGAILAVVAAFPARFRSLLDWRSPLAKNLALTSFPVLLLALLFEKKIKGLLFFPLPVAGALAAGALLMIALGRGKGKKKLEALSGAQALQIGLWQCLALWPGMSRSAMTLIGGMRQGLKGGAAAEYAFLAAVPVLLASTAHELLFHASALKPLLAQLALGFAVSFAVALLAVKGLLFWLQRGGLLPFALYRLCLALLILCFF